MSNAHYLVLACLALVVLAFIVGARLLAVRVAEMRSKRIHPQAASTSIQMASRLEDVRASDNFRNLFEVPVLFYALAALAVAARHTPDWLVLGAWLFVALRYVHSLIHCTYNKVMHRFAVFMTGFVLLVVLWLAFVLTLPAPTTL
jgi:hypothetical protein